MPLPFDDDFDAGLKDDWTVVRGEWRVANGQLTTITGVWEWTSIAVGDPRWSRYAVDVDVDFDGDHHQARIEVRVQDAMDMMVFMLGPTSVSDWYVYRGSEKLLLVGGRTRRARADVHVRIEVRDDLYAAYLDGEPWASVYDPTYQSGRVGLSVFCQGFARCISFDNFRVSPLGE